MAQDPSSGIQPDLLQHLHLVSAAKFPMMPRIEINDVTKILLDAPRIAKTQSPFFWTYLDRPADGTMLLEWQPLARAGVQFATDGLFWAPPENYYKQDVGNGLTLEVYFYKAGYVPGEQATLHSRKRFRLIPTPGAPPGGPQPDPSLFLIHYGPAEQADRGPITAIPYDERMQSIMSNRQYMLRLGAIPRKDFMLGDRVNWPQIHLPRDGRPPFISAAPQRGPPPPPPPEAILAEEEDNFRGDMFDQVTPREIAMVRYQQNHEWMEEIVASPYPLSSIIAPELGFGKKGPLASLTDGVFTAQGIDALEGAPKNAYIQPLDAAKAAEFRARVDAHIDACKAEMVKMKDVHAAVLAKSAADRELVQLEKTLRTSVFADGSDSWSVNGGQDEHDGDDDNNNNNNGGTAGSADSDGGEGGEGGDSGDGDGKGAALKAGTRAADVLAAVQQKLAAQPVAVRRLQRVQDGGYVAPQVRQTTPDASVGVQQQQQQQQQGGAGVADVEMGEDGKADGSGKGDWVMVGEGGETGGKTGDGSVAETVVGAFDGGDFNGMDDMDMAGEALSSYENMEMEESAFGDAFHGVDGNA
ncbi:hypothetical protein TD95_001832 [Thielaviopsis punctulata]|uniref:DUF1750-domain-containing protein n=1 Tax=Thielaviopsis punctulata TaxID=72032 RepID=A0A0F4ZAF3_9PEZI|nr:hypothetical protein TD95_001832 [Thielaviopsis punctulata]